jgi:peptidoglycan hydrolase-like protein with peptidoglycan-binding domain
MSPEDLNRLSSQPAATTPLSVEPGAATPAPAEPPPGAAIISTTGDTASEPKLEPLPPSGPYKPTDKEIQAALKNAGYYTGAIDGKIGPKSKKAIEDFQKANGLKVDGKVGPKTWAALSSYLNLAPAADTAASSSGSTAEIPISAGR